MCLQYAEVFMLRPQLGTEHILAVSVSVSVSVSVKTPVSSRSRDQSNFLFVVCKFVQDIGSQAETLESGSQLCMCIK